LQDALAILLMDSAEVSSASENKRCFSLCGRRIAWPRAIRAAQRPQIREHL